MARTGGDSAATSAHHADGANKSRNACVADAPLTPLAPIPIKIEQRIIAPLADEFRDSGWNIGVVLRRLLASEHFYDPGVIASCLRGPVDLLAGMGGLSFPAHTSFGSSAVAPYDQQCLLSGGSPLHNHRP